MFLKSKVKKSYATQEPDITQNPFWKKCSQVARQELGSGYHHGWFTPYPFSIHFKKTFFGYKYLVFNTVTGEYATSSNEESARAAVRCPENDTEREEGYQRIMDFDINTIL